MQQLSGLDALFVRCEAGNTYLHIGPVMIYAPGAGHSAPDIRKVRKLLGTRLRHAQILRRKLVEVPWKLDKPYWVDDHDFKLEHHISQARLRKPGNLHQFCREIARIHAQPLDRSRPLWMAHFIYGLDAIEGFPPGSYALYLQTHHASMDGATGAAMIGAIHDPEPHARNQLDDEEWSADEKPSTVSLLSRALVNNIRQPFHLAGVAGQALGALQRILKGTLEHRFSSNGWRERTRFNGSIGPDRVMGFLPLSLPEVKSATRLMAGTTINDVALTIIGGAMRLYLAAKGELPGKTLVAGIPVDVRTPESRDSGGNLISVMMVSLCTHIANAQERLKCVHKHSQQAKAYHKEMGTTLVTNLSDSLPQYLVALCSQPVFANGLLGRTPPLLNTAITNVPGPRQPLFFAGAQMKMITGLGPCTDGLGLFHTVSSYCEVITIGFQACPTMLPDPEFYTSCIQQSWDELKATAKNAVDKA